VSGETLLTPSFTSFSILIIYAAAAGLFLMYWFFEPRFRSWKGIAEWRIQDWHFWAMFVSEIAILTIFLVMAATAILLSKVFAAGPWLSRMGSIDSSHAIAELTLPALGLYVYYLHRDSWEAIMWTGAMMWTHEGVWLACYYYLDSSLILPLAWPRVIVSLAGYSALGMVIWTTFINKYGHWKEWLGTLSAYLPYQATWILIGFPISVWNNGMGFGSTKLITDIVTNQIEVLGWIYILALFIVAAHFAFYGKPKMKTPRLVLGKDRIYGELL
jgi:hypothetical protein